MKPVIGIGSNTKYGRVLKVQHDGVVVENGRGEREIVSFRKSESTLKGVKKGVTLYYLKQSARARRFVASTLSMGDLIFSSGTKVSSHVQALGLTASTL